MQLHPSRSLVLLVAAAASAALAPGCATGGGGGDALGAGDGPTVHLREETYLVEGMVFAEVMDDLIRRGPLVDGRRVHASTAWDLKWTYQVTPLEGGCRLENVVVTLDMVVTLPRWLDRDRTPARDAVFQWDRFLQDIRSHEGHHQQIARQGAEELLQALTDLSGPDCATVSRLAEEVAQAQQDQMRARQRALDGGRAP